MEGIIRIKLYGERGIHRTNKKGYLNEVEVTHSFDDHRYCGGLKRVS